MSAGYVDLTARVRELEELVETAAAELDKRDEHLGKLRAVLTDAMGLLGIAEHAMWKLGLHAAGSDLRLSHEVRMFALRFSARTSPEHSLCWTGTGEYRDVRDRAYALLSPKETP